MRAVITVVGKDTVGILATVSAVCAEYSVNILEVSQSVLQELFTMIMLVDISQCAVPFSTLKECFTTTGAKAGLHIHVMHEDIFNSMHKI